jgi:hypothetical protein
MSMKRAITALAISVALFAAACTPSGGTSAPASPGGGGASEAPISSPETSPAESVEPSAS